MAKTSKPLSMALENLGYSPTGSGKFQEEAIDLARDQYETDTARYEQERKQLEDMITRGGGTLEEAGDAANLGNAINLAELGRDKQRLGKEIGYGDFVGGYDSQGAQATADPRASKAQFEVLDELGQRAKGGLTPVERVMMEMNRRKQERDLRGQRDAQLQGMRMRGAGGSGMEVASFLGAQGNTAERRMLEDMAASGLAMERSDRALGQRGALAGDIRGQSFGEAFQRGGAADTASQFNKGLESDYQRQVAQHRQQERRDRWGMETDYSGAIAGAQADKYKYDTAPTYFEQSSRLGTQSNQPNSSQMVQTLMAAQGSQDAKDAADDLQPEKTMIDRVFGGLF